MQKAQSGVDGSIPTYPISSVDNALRLLELFRERKSVRLTDAREYLGVAHSTAHRLLAMLMYHGFVVQDTATRVYRPGPSLIEIGLSVVTNLDIRAFARPFMHELAAEFNETVHLVVLERTTVRYIDGIESRQQLRVGVRTGSVLPAHCTSAGKAMLAQLSEARFDELYPRASDLDKKTDKSITSVRELCRVVEEVRSNGYASNYEESEVGVGSIAVAIREVDEFEAAAIAVAVPTTRLTADYRSRLIVSLADVAGRMGVVNG